MKVKELPAYRVLFATDKGNYQGVGKIPAPTGTVFNFLYMEDQIRWKQRFGSFSKALHQLQRALEIASPSDLEKEGTIQRFEFCHELAWKVMKDFLEYEGIQGMIGSRSATREAFQKNLIQEGKLWMRMIESRNRTVHAYSREILEQEYSLIAAHYVRLLEQFHKTMSAFL